ncbi:MAG: DUF134 domain-containing protein [Acidobacteriota bacterium]
MPRPRLCRKVSATPKAHCFKPQGVPLAELGEAYLTVEGLEALRLADLESLTTSEAAQRMGVSRHTFGRILAQARQAVANALVNALALRIEGGEYSVVEQEPGATPEAAKRPDPGLVAVSAAGPGLDSPVEARFGRAPGFVLVELGSMAATWLDNGPSLAMAHGAGIQTAERVAEAGAGVLLTGMVGAKAFRALREAGVVMGLELGGLSVGQAVERFKAGQVPEAQGPNRPGDQ